MDVNNELFGKDHLQFLMKEPRYSISPKMLIHDLIQKVDDFTHSAGQSDDNTLFAIKSYIQVNNQNHLHGETSQHPE